MAPLLVAEHLSRSYRSMLSLGDVARLRFRRPVVPALADASFGLDEGELLGLVGPNGAGKSTLLRLAAGLLLPTAGRLTVAGHEPYAADPTGRRAVGAVFSDTRSFFWRLSGRENLRFFATLQGLRADRERRVAEVLTLVGLSEAADRRFFEYSTGMRQRLSIARALAHRPRLLLLDEVTEGLDRDFVPQLLALLDRLRADDGVAILYATHHDDELRGRAGRVVRLAAGEAARVLTGAAWQADGGPA
jgi:ABC-2 type transport system ATP-binding protein